MKGVKRRGRDDLTTCSIRKALFLSAGPMPWTASPGQTQSSHWAMPHAAVNSHYDLHVSPVSLSSLMIHFGEGPERVLGGLYLNSLFSVKTLS